jgi:hypothetical protein
MNGAVSNNGDLPSESQAGGISGHTPPHWEMLVCILKASLPSGNAKKAVKHTPHPGPLNHQFSHPTAFPNMQMFSCLLYN